MSVLRGLGGFDELFERREGVVQLLLYGSNDEWFCQSSRMSQWGRTPGRWGLSTGAASSPRR
jgi:hypothetical protein